MSKNKKPVIIVAVVLCALIILPLVVLLVARMGGAAPGEGGRMTAPGGGNGSGRAVVDYDLRQLADRVEGLLNRELATALREGDVSLDFMAGLNREVTRGREALNRGQLERAEALYRSALNTAEAELESIQVAEQARALSEQTFAELQRLEPLKAAFANTYREAVETYNTALRAMQAGRYAESIDGFEMTGAILGELEARTIQQIGGLLEAARAAVKKYDLAGARTAYGEVLKLDPGNTAATEGLENVAALEGIAEEVKAIDALEAAGDFEAALAAVDALAEKHPGNSFLRDLRKALEGRINERKYHALVAEAEAAEARGDYVAAIEALGAALELRPDETQAERLSRLEAQYKTERLEALLTTGYDALGAGRYESARQIYREAVAIGPDSEEARTGLERASSLYLANVRYVQNLEAASRYIREGRYPLAARFFNEAMSSRPGKVSKEQGAEEDRIRAELKAQGREVPVTVRSDGRTFVSIIGVQPPDRFREKEFTLYPDVYTVRGSRSGYKDVEIELKVDARQTNQTIEVRCTERL